MGYNEIHTVVFTKPAKRSLRDNVIHGNFTSLFASINTKNMTVRGWNIEPNMIDEGTEIFPWRKLDAENGDGYLYEYHAVVSFNRKDDQKPSSNEFASYLNTLHTRCSTAQYGSWILATVDEKPYSPPAEDDEITGNITRELIGYSDVSIPAEWDSFFSHLFGRDAHIGRIKDAIIAGIMSDWKNRFHCALVGPPGCGKSDICGSLRRALGEDAVMEYDATATTAAGAIKDLSEREILPRILVVEEIEKADEKALQFLLGVMDLRGEIRKTTARTTIQRDTKVMVIATVNDYALFQKLNAGALASRFANKIGFSRPSRDQLAMILTREVQKINGDSRWIKPTLDYCEDHDITDPRQVIALCLCGRDGLLTGEYQRMLSDTAIEE